MRQLGCSSRINRKCFVQQAAKLQLLVPALVQQQAASRVFPSGTLCSQRNIFIGTSPIRRERQGLSTQRWRAFHVINESIREADDRTGGRLVLSGTNGRNPCGRSGELWLQLRRPCSATAASGHRSSGCAPCGLDLPRGPLWLA